MRIQSKQLKLHRNCSINNLNHLKSQEAEITRMKLTAYSYLLLKYRYIATCVTVHTQINETAAVNWILGKEVDLMKQI